jgi:prevent-host-death family protein
MERFLGVEEARGKLGQLVQEVAAGAEPVVFAKRGQALAVLISRDEYARLKQAGTQVARAELQSRLSKARRKVREAGLDASVIDEAIAAARRVT